MASAWEQLGDIERVNQRLRQAQLSRAVNNIYYAKTFNVFPKMLSSRSLPRRNHD